MKIIYISCNVSLLNEITKILNNNGADSYQIIEQVMSVGKIGNPKLNNFVWPGYNSVIIVTTENIDTYKNLIENLKNYNKNAELDDEKVTVASWNIEDFFWK